MRFRYSPEQLTFLKEQYKELSLEELVVAFNQAFGTDRSIMSIRGATRNHRMKSGRTGHFEKGGPGWNKGIKGWSAGGRSIETRFQKGRLPHHAGNYVPIGTVRTRKDGYLERKINDDQTIYTARRWAMEHRVVWEAANGAIPAGHVVVFLDGDKTNVSLDNLRCVPRGVLQYMNKMKMNNTTGEARTAAILTAEIVTRANQRARA